MATLKKNRSLLLAVVLVSVAASGCTKELRAKRHLSRGEADFKALKYDQAEIEYLKVLQLQPFQPVAVRQLGLMYQEEGKLMHARSFLTKAVEFNPSDPEVRLKLALNDLSLGDIKSAVQNARLVLAKEPGQAEALELIAGSDVSSNGLQGVQQELEKYRQTDKDRASYHVAFATLDVRHQDITNAELEFKKAVELDPKCSSALVGLGTIYFTRKDLPAAEQAFKSAADAAPARSIVRLKYAEFKLVTGKPDEAKQVLQAITAEAPDYLPAWNFQAQVAFGDKKYDECASLLKNVTSRDPYNLDALVLNGSLSLNRGEITKAISIFSQASSIYTRSPQIQFLLARAYLANNDIPKATVCLNQAVRFNPDFADAVLLLAQLNIRKGDPSQAIASLTEFLRRQPRVAQAYLLIANAYQAKGDSVQALANCRRVTELFPKSPDAQLIYGSMLFREGQRTEARKAFEQAQSLAPDSLAPTQDLVELDLLEKQFDAATQRVQALMNRKPGSAEPLLLMAKIHTSKADALVEQENRKNPGGRKLKLADVPAAQPEVSQAEAALLKAIDLNPSLGAPYLMLSKLYISAGKQQQALDRLNGLLSKTNDLAAWMQVGIIHDGMKDYPAARDAYEKVLALNPNFSPALNNLAYLYSEPLPDLDKAQKLAEKARQLLPDDPSTADTLGWVLYKKGDYARALSLLQESASKLSDQPDVQFHLGMAEYMVGDEDAAKPALQRAAKSDKDFPGKDLAARRLAVLAIDPKSADAKTVDDLQKLLQEFPQDPIALDRLGSIQERDGQLQKAADTYQTALKYNAQDSSLTLKLAELYARLNDPQKALSLAKTAHDLSPNDPHISALLGQLVYRTGDYKWAASLLEDSARKLPDDPQVTFDLAWAYYSVGRVSAAKDLMQKVANAGNASKADDAKNFLAAVEASATPAQSSAFASDAKQMLSKDPEYVPALMVSAVALEGQGSYQESADVYKRVLAHYPLFTPAMRNLGLLYFSRLNDDEKGYDLVLKARESFPQDADVSKALGIMTYRKGNFSRAAQLLSESAQNRKGDAELLYYLGMSQYKLKAKSQSKAALQQALSFDLSSKLASDAKRVLAELK